MKIKQETVITKTMSKKESDSLYSLLDGERRRKKSTSCVDQSVVQDLMILLEEADSEY